MRKLIVRAFVTLDGVIEAPGHDPHQDGKNRVRLNMEEYRRYRLDLDGTAFPSPLRSNPILVPSLD